jgi:hypothetical protein
MFVAKVQCGCGVNVRVRVEHGNSGEASCWNCPAGRVRVVRSGGRVHGFTMGMMQFHWSDTSAFMDADENNMHRPKKKKGMARW